MADEPRHESQFSMGEQWLSDDCRGKLTYDYERPGVVVLLLAETVHRQHDEAHDEEDEAARDEEGDQLAVHHPPVPCVQDPNILSPAHSEMEDRFEYLNCSHINPGGQ